MSLRRFLCLAALPLALSASLYAANLPGDSVYQLKLPLTDARGQSFKLADLAGQPLTITMFYANCQLACPLTLEALKHSANALPPRLRARLHILLVSLDPARDTPAMLSMDQQQHRLDPRIFRLALAADDAQTRTLASVLGVKYRRLDNGEINHTTRVVLLDAQGRIVAFSEHIGAGVDAQLLADWRGSLGAKVE